ncbi:acetyl-CoA carboxylase carboxyltransferase subunit alpha [bacterium]|nr:acetyl-CoA carboxylase carboxyltransferase subunit alpha [bacterium]
MATLEAFFEFEKPIANLEKKLSDLRELAQQGGVDFSQEMTTLEKKVATLIDETYSKLTPWQKVQLSRHPNRPYTRDYIDLLFPDFMELQGDRYYGDDQALLTGVATWPPIDPSDAPNASALESDLTRTPILIIGHQKGRSTKQKMERNFGMAKPDGYRKAMRVMELAERSRMPILTFIDTPGAYPGQDAEERGQAQAIAESIHKMFTLEVPIVSVVIGEGGSGGALAIGVADRVLMQEYSIYSVISPESCASILWSDSSLAERAADRLKMNPHELLKLGVIDAVVPEPKGGAHRDWIGAAKLLKKAIIKQFEDLSEFPKVPAKAPAKSSAKNSKSSAKTAAKLPRTRIEARSEKFRKMGSVGLAYAPVEEEGSNHVTQ